MQQLEPTYLRYVYDGLSKGSISSNNPTSLPIGFIGLFEDEFPSSMLLVERMSILNRLATWALLKGPVSIEMVAEILDEHPDNTKALVNTYSKWFNSPEPGKYVLYHDRLRTYLLQKLSNHEVQDLNETLISYLENTLVSKGLKEAELYALEHLSTHMAVESQMGNNYERLHHFVNQENLWHKQISTSKEYIWSQKAVRYGIKEGARRQDEMKTLRASVSSVKLMQEEESSIESVLNFLDHGDYSISLKRVQNWGHQRKLNVFLLMLYDLTIGHLNKKSFKKEACFAIIEELKKVDYSTISCNLFPTITIYVIHLELKKIGSEIDFIWRNIDNDFTEVFQQTNTFDLEIKNFGHKIFEEEHKINKSELLIKKYNQEQQKNVNDNREFNSLAKEIEFQELEIQLAEKKIKKFSDQLDKLSLIYSFKKYISKIDYEDIISVIHLSLKPKDYIVFIAHFFDVVHLNYNYKKGEISNNIPGESIINSLVDSIDEKYQISEGLIPDPYDEIFDRSFVDIFINEISNKLKTNFNLNTKLIFSSALHNNSKALTKKIFELKGNILNKLESISGLRKQNGSDYIRLIKIYYNIDVNSNFSSKNSNFLQNNVLNTIRQTMISANVAESSKLALYNYYALTSFRFLNLLKSKEIIINGLNTINPTIEKHKKSFFSEMKNKTIKEQTALILSLDKSYNIEGVNNYLNGEIGGLYTEDNIVKKHLLLESIAILIKLVYSFQKKSSDYNDFKEFADEIFNIIYRIINTIIDIFYYEDFNNIDDETITKINEKIQPNLNRGEKLNMNLDFKYYLIFKYIEFDDFFNSKMNNTSNLPRYNFLPLSISDSIPEIINKNKGRHLKIGSLIIKNKIFLNDDVIKLIIDSLLNDKKINEAFELSKFIYSNSPSIYFKILETKYPIKIPKKEIFNILNELESNFDIFIKHESYFIDNYISLYSKTNSVRAKIIIFNIIIHQLTLIDTVSFFNTTVSLINNSLFNSRAELLNQLLSSRIMEIFKTGNGEMIISVIMTIKKYKNFSEIQLLKILNKASKNLSIKCYISISDYLYKNIKNFDEIYGNSSSSINFDDIRFFADSYIQLVNSNKILFENIDKKNDNGAAKIVDTYFNFYKVFETLSKAYNINSDLTGYYYSCFYSKIIELNHVIESLVFDKLLINNFIDNKFIIGNIDQDYEFLDDLTGSNFITQSSINFEEMSGLFFIYLRESMINQWDHNYLYNYSILFEYAILYNLNNRFDLSLKCIDLMPKKFKDLTLYYLCKNFTDEKIFLKSIKSISSAYFKILAYIDVFSLNFNLDTSKIPNNFNDLLELIKGHYNEAEKQSLFLNFYSSMLDNSMKKEQKILEKIIKNKYGDESIKGLSKLIDSNSKENIELLFEKIKHFEIWYGEGSRPEPGNAQGHFFNQLDLEISIFKKSIHLVYNSNDIEKKKYLNDEIDNFKYICGDTEAELSSIALANIFLIRALKYFYLGENSKSIALLNRGFKEISI